MKWYCNRGRNNNAVWIAVMAVLISSQSSVRHHRLSLAWLVGLIVGVVATVTVGFVVARRKRCL